MTDIISSAKNDDLELNKRVYSEADVDENKPTPSIDVKNNKDSKDDIPLSQKRNLAENPFHRVYIYIWNNNTRKTYTLLSVTFGFISLLILLAILPTITSIVEISKKIQDYQGILSKQTSKLSNLSNLRSQASFPIASNGLHEYVDFLDKTFLTDNSQNEDIFKDLIAKTVTTKVTLLSLRNLDYNSSSALISTDSHLKTIGLQITLQSSDQQNIFAFINTLSNANHLYTIQKVDILSNSVASTTSPNSKNPTTSIQYSTNISFTYYYYV